MSSRCFAFFALVALVIALVASLAPFAAKASADCELAEEQATCQSEKEAEEAFWARVEREQREAKEKEEAEEAELRQQELREAQRERREAREWAVKPKVKLKRARAMSLGLLHQRVPTWTYRKLGFLDCASGRIDRSHWRCRANWIAGSICHSGRIQIVGAGHRNHRAIYESHMQYKSGHGYVYRGRIRCFFPDDPEFD